MSSASIQLDAAEIRENCQSNWGWQPNPRTSFGYIAKLSSRWSEEPLEFSNGLAVQRELVKAAQNKARWLLHPCFAPVFDQRFLSHDAQARLVVWAAAHCKHAIEAFGAVTFNHKVSLFAPSGNFSADRGTHRLDDLVDNAPEALPSLMMNGPIPDPWGTTLPYADAIGELASAAWWTSGHLDGDNRDQCKVDVIELLRTQRTLEVTLPECYSWFAGMTKVVIPLRKSSNGQFRSGSVAGLPGLIAVEMTGNYLLTLEALIHETAHLYFHFAELADPFVRADQSALYSSPLRIDRRPLRGIFLAFHALLYMCLLYRDWFAATGDARCLEALADLRLKRRDAGETLASARDCLSESGKAFLARCELMALIDDRAEAEQRDG